VNYKSRVWNKQWKGLLGIPCGKQLAAETLVQDIFRPFKRFSCLAPWPFWAQLLMFEASRVWISGRQKEVVAHLIEYTND